MYRNLMLKPAGVTGKINCGSSLSDHDAVNMDYAKYVAACEAAVCTYRKSGGLATTDFLSQVL